MLRCIVVLGTLRFSRSASTCLRVGTLQLHDGGTLDIGPPEAPGVTTDIAFSGTINPGIFYLCWVACWTALCRACCSCGWVVSAVSASHPQLLLLTCSKARTVDPLHLARSGGPQCRDHWPGGLPCQRPHLW